MNPILVGSRRAGLTEVAHGTENRSRKFHRRLLLRSVHLCEVDSAAGHDAGREVRPASPLHVVIEVGEDVLTLGCI